MLLELKLSCDASPAAPAMDSVPDEIASPVEPLMLVHVAPLSPESGDLPVKAEPDENVSTIAVCPRTAAGRSIASKIGMRRLIMMSVVFRVGGVWTKLLR